jgi:hypothetical protein
MNIVYGVQIEIDEGEYEYVREKTGNSWATTDSVLTFDNKEDALIEAKKWNTGVVVNLSKNAQ